jgi:glycerol-3-phosphate cytidylyltransferase
MRTILTYGTFDLLHIGHINLLKRARAMGDRLIVAVSTDDFNRNEKNKACVNTYADRKVILESLRFVDEVIPEENWEQKITDVDKYHVDIFTMGDDWTGHFDFLRDKCEVVYLPRTTNISTTEIKLAIVSTSQD